MFENKNHYNDPMHILKRGYSITLFQGKPVKKAEGLKEGDLLDTMLSDGKVQSRVSGTTK
jgi:exodeoxyribonuclease VII large subunit